MEFSLPAAIWGALVGATVVFAALAYLRAMPDPPAGAGYWTAAFGLNVLRHACYLLGATFDPVFMTFLGECLQTASGLLLLVGSLRFAKKEVPAWFLPASMILVIAWAGYTTLIENNFLLRSVPLYGISGAALIFAGYVMLRIRHDDTVAAAKFVGVTLILWGLHKFDFPWLRPVTWFAPIGFLLAQTLAMAAAVGFLLLMASQLRVIASEARQKHAQSRDHLATLNQLLQVSLGGKSLKAQLAEALEIVIAAPWLALEPRGAFFLVEQGQLSLTVQRNLNPDLLTTCAKVEFGHCLCGRAAATRSILHAAHVDERHDNIYEGMKPHGHYAAPVVYGGDVLGVLLLYLPDGQRKDDSEVAHLRAVTDVIAGMIVRKRVEAESEQSRSRLVVAQRIAHVGSWELDLVNDTVLWSDEEFRILGYQPGEIEPSHEAFLARVHPEDRAVVVAAMADLEHQETLSIDHRIVHPNGDVLYVSDSAVLERDESGRVSRMYGTLQDVTEAKASERALQDAKVEAELANKAKTAFLANMSHELRTPLNAVIGFAQLLERLPSNGPRSREQVEKNKEYLGHIRESGEHLLAVINDILDVSRIEAGRAALVEAPVDLAELVRRTVSLMDPRAKSGGLSLSHEMSGGLPSVLGDERAIKQILINIVGNAMKFTDPGGKVVVELHRVDGDLELAVRDTGIGISTKDLARIFEPFVQVESELNRRFEGTGLGLPLVKKLVELHGGRIDLESVPNQGTRVSVVFPSKRLVDPPPMSRAG